MATLRDDLGRGAGAEQGGHRRMIAELCARWDKEQREAPRSGAEIQAQFDAVGVAQRETASIGEQVDIEIILPDRAERETALIPRHVDLAEIDRAGRWL